jgi:hypothetical protein
MEEQRHNLEFVQHYCVRYQREPGCMLLHVHVSTTLAIRQKTQHHVLEMDSQDGKYILEMGLAVLFFSAISEYFGRKIFYVYSTLWHTIFFVIAVAVPSFPMVVIFRLMPGMVSAPLHHCGRQLGIHVQHTGPCVDDLLLARRGQLGSTCWINLQCLCDGGSELVSGLCLWSSFCSPVHRSITRTAKL